MDAMKILMVDDNDDDFFFFKHAVTKLGEPIELFRATDGLEAQAYLSEMNPQANRCNPPLPDVLVSDLEMPRCDGLELLRWFKTKPEPKPVPFVLTASATPSNQMAITDLGARASGLPKLSLEDATRIFAYLDATRPGWLKPRTAMFLDHFLPCVEAKIHLSLTV